MPAGFKIYLLFWLFNNLPTGSPEWCITSILCQSKGTTEHDIIIKASAKKHGFNVQNLLPRNALQKCCSEKFYKIQRKKLPCKYPQPTTILVKNFHGSYFRVNFVKLFTKTSLQNTSVQLLKIFQQQKKVAFSSSYITYLKRNFLFLKRPDLNYHLKVYSLFIYEVV